MLTRLVRDEQIRWVIIGGDEVIAPLLQEHMPKDVAERLIDVVAMDIRAPERLVLERALELTGRKDEESDRERVSALLDAYRSGGPGVIGVERVRRALELGQVDELLITAQATAFEAVAGSASDARPQPNVRQRNVLPMSWSRKRDRPRHRSALSKIPGLLEPYGGVGAFLRFLV